MKRWVLLLLLLSVLLTGCGKQQDTIQAAICLRQCADSLTAEKLDAMRTALVDAGYAVAAADAEEDQARQTQQISDLIEEGYDLLVVEPVMMEMAGSIAQMGVDAEVPVIFVGFQPEDTEQVLCYVGSRLEQCGAMQAQILQQLPDGGDLNGDGTVTYAVIAGPEEDLDARILTDACTEALAGTCLEICYTDWSKEAAFNRCVKLLSSYGKDLEVVLCNSDTLAMGAMDAIAEGGRTTGKDIYLAGAGGDFQSRLRIRSGDLSGTVYLPADTLAAMVAETAVKLLKNEPVERQQYAEYVLLTKETVEDYIPKNAQ